VTIYESPRAAELAARFLRSETGRGIVRRTLATQRLPLTLADDLIQDTLRRVWVATNGTGLAVDNLEAFVSTLLRRSAVDIVRGRIRSPQVIDRRAAVDPDAEVQGWPFDGPSPLDVEADALAGESLAVIRRAIHNGLSVDPVAGAAALAYLAVTVDGAPVAPHCPQPAGGATAVEAAEWVALWYAGRHDCFSIDAAIQPATVRKRRSRWTRRFRDLLTRVATAVGLEREGALHA
jgi:hypothetical protein